MGTSLIGTLLLGTAASLWSFMSLIQFIGYFIYINVEYPYHTEMFFSMLDSSFWEHVPNIIALLFKSQFKLTDEQIEEYYSPPSKFRYRGKNSFFVENGVHIILANFLIWFVLQFVEALRRKGQALVKNPILQAIKAMLKWNVVFRVFLENSVPLAFATFLQLKSLSFDEAHLGISSTLAILSCIYIITMVAYLVKVLYKRDDIQLKLKLTKKVYGTLYQGVTLQTKAKYYHIIILIRGLLSPVFIVLLSDLSVFSIFSLLVLNLGVLYYLFKEIKITDATLNIIIRLKELLIIIGELCIVLLYVQVQNESYYDAVGWFIVGSLGFAVVIDIGYLLILQVFGVKEIWRKILFGSQVISLYLRSMKKTQQRNIRIQGRIRKLKIRKVNIQEEKS